MPRHNGKGLLLNNFFSALFTNWMALISHSLLPFSVRPIVQLQWGREFLSGWWPLWIFHQWAKVWRPSQTVVLFPSVAMGFCTFFPFPSRSLSNIFFTPPPFSPNVKGDYKGQSGRHLICPNGFFCCKGPLNHLSSCALQFGYHVVGCTAGLCSSCLCTWLSSSTRTRC